MPIPIIPYKFPLKKPLTQRIGSLKKMHSNYLKSLFPYQFPFKKAFKKRQKTLKKALNRAFKLSCMFP